MIQTSCINVVNSYKIKGNFIAAYIQLFEYLFRMLSFFPSPCPMVHFVRQFLFSFHNWYRRMEQMRIKTHTYMEMNSYNTKAVSLNDPRREKKFSNTLLLILAVLRIRLNARIIMCAFLYSNTCASGCMCVCVYLCEIVCFYARVREWMCEVYDVNHVCITFIRNCMFIYTNFIYLILFV